MEVLTISESVIGLLWRNMQCRKDQSNSPTCGKGYGSDDMAHVPTINELAAKLARYNAYPQRGIISTPAGHITL